MTTGWDATVFPSPAPVHVTITLPTLRAPKLIRDVLFLGTLIKPWNPFHLLNVCMSGSRHGRQGRRKEEKGVSQTQISASDFSSVTNSVSGLNKTLAASSLSFPSTSNWLHRDNTGLLVEDKSGIPMLRLCASLNARLSGERERGCSAHTLLWGFSGAFCWLTVRDRLLAWMDTHWNHPARLFKPTLQGCCKDCGDNKSDKCFGLSKAWCQC